MFGSSTVPNYPWFGVVQAHLTLLNIQEPQQQDTVATTQQDQDTAADGSTQDTATDGSTQISRSVLGGGGRSVLLLWFL